MEVEEYKTAAAYVETEITIKGSRFIGQLYPAATLSEVEKYLSDCRKEYRDATHRCYAFRLGPDGGTNRFSDDGEPSGTAGKPILSLLERNKITDVLLIVIRYFGGTKLGTGGLVRAYTGASRSVLNEATIISIPVLLGLKITFPYDYTSGVMRIISQHDLKIFDTDYREDITISLGIRPSLVESVRTLLQDATSGNIAIKQ